MMISLEARGAQACKKIEESFKNEAKTASQVPSKTRFLANHWRALFLGDLVNGRCLSKTQGLSFFYLPLRISLIQLSLTPFTKQESQHGKSTTKSPSTSSL